MQQGSKISVAVMATRSKVRFSEAPAQHSNSEQQSSGWGSWLFGGRKSKEEHNNNVSHGHTTTVQPSAKVGERHAAHSGDGRIIKISEEVEEVHEDETVDMEAEDFIARQRKKLEMERLKSMKRLDSMLVRGL